MDSDNVFSVTEVNKHLKNIIENNIPSLFVEGEISNFSKPYSGHIYFNLKDEQSTIKCVFFKQHNLYLKFNPKNGDKVVCGGKLTVYERDGIYQLQVQNMASTGTGSLQLRFEELRKILLTEGLFESQYKKPIPRYPQKVGVITSATGAAFQDICQVITRRYPVDILLYPASVQGEYAVSELIRGLDYFQTNPIVDVIIIGRGGGSQEDLFCFNDEMLARKVFQMKIPIVSAVGHETDFTIIDFVSDLRAPTPSAAAELVVPDKTDLKQKILQIQSRISKSVRHLQMEKKVDISLLDKKLQRFHPINVLRDRMQFLDQLTVKLGRISRLTDEKKYQITSLNKQLQTLFIQNSQKNLMLNRENLKKSEIILQHRLFAELQDRKQKLELMEMTLKEFAPARVLQKGYALIRREKSIISSVKQLVPGDQIELELKDGKAQCQVNSLLEK